MRVLQLIDTLEAGGAERMAVNLANALVSKVEKSYLCTTREEGILQPTIDNKVTYLFLNKANTLDLFAIRRFYALLKREHIDIVHAHSSSFFLAALVARLLPKLKVVWHDHYGNSEFLNQRPKSMLRACSGQFSHSFGVNKELVAWAKQHLQHNSVSYLPNFIALDTAKERLTVLKGKKGKRIVCLANLRGQKDHINLLRAFSLISKDFPEYSLHCIGKDFGDDYANKVYQLTSDLNLTSQVFFYGACADTSVMLSDCDIGVLSSKSEGLPLAILEYGLAQLPVVVTDVGDCGLVVQHECSGLVVPPEDSKALYLGIRSLILNIQNSKQLGARLQQTVTDKYTASVVIDVVLKYYNVL
jgi:glycosyltransferase involved in cell wall biosynthesis